VYYLAYWYPQMAVYDDLNRWQVDPYMGNAEFYMGYGDYDVAITVPAGFTADGRPVGLQIAARHRRDALVLRTAANFEAARPWADKKPADSLVVA